MCSQNVLESHEESSLAASGQFLREQISELRSYVTGDGLAAGPSLET